MPKAAKASGKASNVLMSLYTSALRLGFPHTRRRNIIGRLYAYSHDIHAAFPLDRHNLRMRKIAVIDGHPDPDRAHLDHALADRYTQAARAAGHEVRRVNVAELNIPVLRVPSEFISGEAPREIADAQRDITWADHLVFVFPLWHGYMPAYFKAFIEQVFRPGYAMAYNAKGFPKQLLDPKSARIIVTMGMPAFFYRGYFGAHGLKAFEHSVLGFAGIAPIHTTLLGGVGEVSPGKADHWLAQMDELAQHDGEEPAPERVRLLPKIAKTATVIAGVSAAGIAAWRYAASRR